MTDAVIAKGRGPVKFRCPKCGATAALSLSVREARATEVALKCVMCAHVTRVPRNLSPGPVPAT